MLIIPFLSSVFILALVLFETQNAVKAVFFAVDWPADVKLRNSPSGLQACREPLTVRTRIAMGLSRLAYCSLILHEVQCLFRHEPAAFRASPSVAFGAAVAATLYAIGLQVPSVIALSVCSACLLFASSQVRSLVRFQAARASKDREVALLFARLEA